MNRKVYLKHIDNALRQVVLRLNGDFLRELVALLRDLPLDELFAFFKRQQSNLLNPKVFELEVILRKSDVLPIIGELVLVFLVDELVEALFCLQKCPLLKKRFPLSLCAHQCSQL